MSTLYSSNLWIESSKAVPIVNAGIHFLKAYSRLATLSHARKESRYPVVPKCHMLFHVCHFLRVQTRCTEWVLNPIAYSTASDEDFIGRYCYLTRCVSPRQRILRSIQRYLTQISMFWARKEWDCNQGEEMEIVRCCLGLVFIWFVQSDFIQNFDVFVCVPPGVSKPWKSKNLTIGVHA